MLLPLPVPHLPGQALVGDEGLNAGRNLPDQKVLEISGGCEAPERRSHTSFITEGMAEEKRFVAAGGLWPLEDVSLEQ
jgi:hypothetical protein